MHSGPFLLQIKIVFIYLFLYGQNVIICLLQCVLNPQGYIDLVSEIENR